MSTAALGALVVPRAARADLEADVAALKQGLEKDGARVVEAPPAFLEAGEVRLVEPLSLVPSEDACVTFVLLTPRTVDVTIVRGEAGESAEEILSRRAADKDAARERSVAGLYARTACRNDVSSLERVAVEMRSPRGAVEMLVARSSAPPPSLDRIELARARGDDAPPSDPGGPMKPLPIEARLRRSSANEKANGASNVVTVNMKASPAGAGELDLRVSAGCHAFDVFDAAAGGVDLDADLLAAAGGETLAADRGEAPDAHLETCTPEVSALSLRFVGAEPSTDVFVSDALFPWPAFVDERWGERVATTFANLFRRRSVPAPDSPPIAEILGGEGSSIATVEVEPGRCYLASVALSRGRSRGVRLAASASSRTAMEEGGALSEGASVVFCSEDQDHATVRVDAPSASNWWVLSVWPLGVASGAKP